MKSFYLIILLIINALFSAFSQVKVAGTIKDKEGVAIPLANVYLQNTFDGANSDLEGNFSFIANEVGNQTIVVSYIGYKTIEIAIDLAYTNENINVVLIEEINKIDGVTISAGAFESSDIKKITVLKPMDIVTTASAAGDIMGAINTLPGTTTVGESGRLFVRGGEGYETKVFIDGLEVRNAFGATAPNVPTRGRFSPFLFKGTVFSTGGYSAEYGQALSSALVLNSNDIAEKSQGDISIMSVGGDLAYTKKWDRTSASAKVQFTDLSPYQNLVKQDYDWSEAPSSQEAEFVVRQQVRKHGMVKLYTNMSRSNLGILQPNIDKGGLKDTIGVKNDYMYINASYRDLLSKKVTIRGGISGSTNVEDLSFNQLGKSQTDNGLHGKIAINWDATSKISINTGSEYYHNSFTQSLSSLGQTASEETFTDNMVSNFIEGDYFASNAFVVRAGVRQEYSSLLNQTFISPRLAMSYKVTEKGQFSLAYGNFVQSAQNNYALVNRSLQPEQAKHYIANYQYIHNGRIFRVETYLKEYDNLIKFTDPNTVNALNYTNLGYGSAKGVDVFWRDNKTFKETDYWVSYSFVDAKRDYMNFPTAATPSFVAKHNISVVVKRFIPSIRTMFGATYNFASNRPFHNPNKAGFQNDKTPNFHDLSLNAAFLINQHTILYMSSSNVLGRDNVFGYNYASKPNENGIYDRQAVGQVAKRFIFVGLFITLTKEGKENQLNNL